VNGYFVWIDLPVLLLHAVAFASNKNGRKVGVGKSSWTVDQRHAKTSLELGTRARAYWRRREVDAVTSYR